MGVISGSCPIAFFEQIVERKWPVPQSWKLTVIAQDQSILVNRKILTAQIWVLGTCWASHAVDYNLGIQ